MKKHVLITWLVMLNWGLGKAQSQPNPTTNQGARLAISESTSQQSFTKGSLKLPVLLKDGTRKIIEYKDFKLKDENPIVDNYGYQHFHYTQTINGIEVDGAEMRVHVKNGIIEDQTGSWLLTPSEHLQSLKPAKNETEVLKQVQMNLGSIQISKTSLLADNRARLDGATIPSDANLVYVPVGKDFENISPDSVKLAYRFTVEARPFKKWMFYVRFFIQNEKKFTFQTK